MVADAVLLHVDEALAASHREVFDALDEAFCVIEMIFDEASRPVDYRFVEVNKAYEDHTGLSDVMGRTILEVLPGVEPDRDRNVRSGRARGEPIRFVHESSPCAVGTTCTPGRSEGQATTGWRFTSRTSPTASMPKTNSAYLSEQFHALIKQAPIGVYLIDADFRIVK